MTNSQHARSVERESAARSRRSLARVAVATWLGITALGCASFGQVGSARPTPPHAWSFDYGWSVVHAERRHADTRAFEGRTSTSDSAAVLPDSLVVRRGLGRATDVGVRFAALRAPRIDVKARIVDSDVVDVTLDPAVQVSIDSKYRSGAAGSLHTLVGLSPDDQVELVFAPGVAVVLPPDAAPNTAEPGGVLALYGAGLRLGSERVGFTLECHGARSFGDDRSTLFEVDFGVTLGRRAGRNAK